MSNYAESKNQIEAIRNKDEIMFRMAISHLMDVGIRHLSEDNVTQCCEEIMKQDDSHSFMTNEFQCDLVKMAGRLAKIDHLHLLNYISKEVYYDVGDNQLSYNRVTELLNECMYHIEDNRFLSDKDVLYMFREIGFTDDEIELLGYEYLLKESAELISDDEKE